MLHASAVVDPGSQVGAGVKIWHFCHISKGSHIGENSILGQNVFIGEDVTIGARCKIQNNVSVFKGVSLEADVFVGPNAAFTNVEFPRAFINQKPNFAQTIVRTGASLGANCTIVCPSEIGAYSMIAAGALVKGYVPRHALAVGSPAQVAGFVCQCGKKIAANLICQSCAKRYKLIDIDLTIHKKVIAARDASMDKKEMILC